MAKILLFIDSLGAGGAQRQIVGLAFLLQQKGFSVKICTYHDIGFYKSFLDEHDIPNEIIQNASSTKKRILAVHRYFKVEKPDWVISYLETPSLVACLSRLLGGRFKLIVSERNTTQQVGKSEKVRFFLYHWANAIVPNSYSQQEWLVGHYPWMAKRTVTISNFVDLNRFTCVKKQRRTVPVIMIAATIWASKNTSGLVEAAKILKEKNVKCIIRWYGKADKYFDYYEECNKKIIEYGLQQMVELLPKVKEIDKKYHEADYFCLPSFYEGTPNVICEAIASGLPVICSNVCDNPRYVHDGENGFLFDPDNPMDIASKIEQAIQMDSEQYNCFCKNCRRIAEELLSEEVFVKKYIDVIQTF